MTCTATTAPAPWCCRSSVAAGPSSTGSARRRARGRPPRADQGRMESPAAIHRPCESDLANRPGSPTSQDKLYVSRTCLRVFNRILKFAKASGERSHEGRTEESREGEE